MVVAGSYSVIYYRVYAGLHLKNCQKELLMQTQILCLIKIHVHGYFYGWLFIDQHKGGI